MSKRILLVDDEEHIREIAATSLELVGGWSVVTAASGAQAIEIAKRDFPDAILLDVMMPGLDGPDTFRELQKAESTRNIPVILLTAKVQANDRRQFSDLGVAGVVAKPFDPMKLPGQISHALGWEA